MGFKLSNRASAGGTSLQGYISLLYHDLVAAFGEPIESDGYKVSSEWIFQDDKGNTFTLYDYKETSLYSSDYPSVEEFRNSGKPYDWHVGANVEIEIFKKWLKETVKSVPVVKKAKPKKTVKKIELSLTKSQFEIVKQAVSFLSTNTVKAEEELDVVISKKKVLEVETLVYDTKE